MLSAHTARCIWFFLLPIKNKTGVVAEGLKLGTPYELTWSCYEGGDTPCGECGTCMDRAKAFAENGVEDPWNGGKG